VITAVAKFGGAAKDLLVTSAVVGFVLLIRPTTARCLRLAQHLACNLRGTAATPRSISQPKLPTAAVRVPSYGGVGIHTVLNIFRPFPNHFQNLIFISVGVIDSGGFKAPLRGRPRSRAPKPC
jgi:hypothetical protein